MKDNNKVSLLGGRLVGDFKRISVSLLLGANLCTILMLWLCVALTFVSPEHLPRLSLLTLAFPVFLVANLLFVAFWLIFYARLAWVPIAGLLAVGDYVLDYCPLRLGPADSTPDGLTVVSYNIGQMRDEAQKAELLRFLNTVDADIICLQEVSKKFLTDHQAWLDSSAYHALEGHSIAILSRFPFLGDTIHIGYNSRYNHSIACWIDCRGDSLLVVNNHLESNKLSPKEKEEYTHAITEPHRETIKSSSRMLLGKLSEATAYRGAQADTICSLINRFAGHSTIVCGDLNETPISYTYQQLARRLTSAYRQAGRGVGFSYSERSFPVRIDHLFYSDEWTCTSCHIDHTVSASDHYPLIASLHKKVR